MLNYFKRINFRREKIAVAWVLALISSLPVLFIVWLSILNSEDIQKSVFFPQKRNDKVTFFVPTEKDIIVATNLGYIRNFEGKEILNINSVSTVYAQNKASLWAFSANRGLIEIDMKDKQEKKSYDWNFFRNSYENFDQSRFLVSGDVLPKHFVELANYLNTAPALPSENENITVSSLVGFKFFESEEIINQLNWILANDKILNSILDYWTKREDWLNPQIYNLKKNKNISEKEKHLLFRFCLSELFPNEISRVKFFPWQDLWISQIVSSGLAILATENKVAIGVRGDFFPGVAIFDTETKQVTWITEATGLPNASVQNIVKISKPSTIQNDTILVVHDIGFSIIQLESRKIIRNVMFGEHELPDLAGQNLYIKVYEEPPPKEKVLPNEIILQDEIIVLPSKKGLPAKKPPPSQAKKTPLGKKALPEPKVSIPEEKVPLPSEKTLLNRKISINYGTRNLIFNYDNFKIEQKQEQEQEQTLDYSSISSYYENKNGYKWVGYGDGKLEVLNESNLNIQTSSIPKGKRTFQWNNYQDIIKIMPIGPFFKNSILLSLSISLLCTFLAILPSYAISRLRFFGKAAFARIMLSSQVLSSLPFLIPIFVIFNILQMKSFQLFNNFTIIILVNIAFFLPLAVQFLFNMFKAIPPNLEESAMIDGCTPWTTFWKIIIPIILPSLAICLVYIFLFAWDEILFIWILSTDSTTATLPVGIRLTVGQLANRPELLMAFSIIASLPPILLFALIQPLLIKEKIMPFNLNKLFKMLIQPQKLVSKFSQWKISLKHIPKFSSQKDLRAKLPSFMRNEGKNT
ncbi:MAG: carbohydrate ABC transporter permease [Fibromonadaceae bacterium]|jgi:ABC-type glycerol-3-phosphate transport system permease component|nr:carbohydrate ABC transporter permease [Fibromonadaceae bacterium]